MHLLQHVLVAMLSAAAGFAQSAPGFEAASVKPAASTSARQSLRGGPGSGDPARITYTNATLMAVLLRAYDVKAYQAIGPDWLSSQRYDIAAKIPPGTTKEQFQRMLQTLIAERFHLVLHHETREIQGFALSIARNGPKLKPAAASSAAGQNQPDSAGPPRVDASGFPILPAPGMEIMEGVRGRSVISFLTAKSQPVAALCEMLSKEFRMPIRDKTGLGGKFDFTLEFAPQPPGALAATPPGDPVPTAADDSGPNLTSAVQQQLGLRLSPAKIATDILVVDRADRVPVEN